MGKIYTNFDDFAKAAEEEFCAKVEEIAYYRGNSERVTLDGEWTESELKDDVYEEVVKILNGTDGKVGLADKYKDRALIDRNLLLPEYMATNICDTYDLIFVYNTLVDKHRNDADRKFGICYFDDIVREEVEKTLKRNLVTK